MARLRTEIKRAFLRSLWRAAKDTRTLEVCLTDFQDTCFGWVKHGRIVANTSGGGYSTAYSALQGLEITPGEVLAFSEELIALRLESVDALTTAGTATDDESVLAEMLERGACDGGSGPAFTVPDFSLRSI